MRKTYYTEQGKVKALRTYNYVGIRRGQRRELTFGATDRATADGYARAWANRRGYKIYRKKRQ
jgi:hypothetical protein